MMTLYYPPHPLIFVTERYNSVTSKTNKIKYLSENVTM